MATKATEAKTYVIQARNAPSSDVLKIIQQTHADAIVRKANENHP